MAADVIGPLVGVAVGFALNEAAWWVRHERTERVRHKNVRILVRLEHEHNITALKGFWGQVNSTRYMQQVAGYSVGYSPVEQDFEQRYQLVTTLLLDWEHVMWQSQAASLAGALNESEIDRSFVLNSQLDTLTMLRERMREAYQHAGVLMGEYVEWREYVSRELAAEVGHELTQSKPVLFGKLMAFNDSTTRSIWQECQHICNTVLGQGNPVGKQTHASSVSRRVAALLPSRMFRMRAQRGQH